MNPARNTVCLRLAAGAWLPVRDTMERPETPPVRGAGQ